MPALYNLCRKGRLAGEISIIGFARRDWSDDEFRSKMQGGVKEFAGKSYEEPAWNKFASRLSYVRGDLTNASDFDRLDQSLRVGEGTSDRGNRLYYLSISPKYYEPVVGMLGSAGMVREEAGWRRVVIEKPYGHDLPSAQSLNRAVQSVFAEQQIFRIDHYLGKETAQNVLFFRFGNTVFEPIWNRNYVDQVQITVAETVDVGHRAGFYDGTGVLRDMFQNHLMQLLALVSMEPPASFHADAVRNEKIKLLSAIQPILPENLAKRVSRRPPEARTFSWGMPHTQT